MNIYLRLIALALGATLFLYGLRSIVGTDVLVGVIGFALIIGAAIPSNR